MLKTLCHTDDQLSPHNCNQQQQTRRTSDTKTMRVCRQANRPSGPKHGNRIPTVNRVCQLAGIALNLVLLIAHNELRSAQAHKFTIKHDIPSSAASQQHQQDRHEQSSMHLDLFRPLVEQQQQQQHDSYPQVNFQYAPDSRQTRRSSDETGPNELLSASPGESLASGMGAGADQQQEQREDESEAQQLRQLHQVVDTVAHLLNEEEEQRQRQTQTQSPPGQLPQMAALQSAGPEEFRLTAEASEPQLRLQQQPAQEQQQLAPNDGFQLQSAEGQQTDGQQETAIPAELMSESAIRQAIEELERVQQQERQRQEQQQQQDMASAESSQKASVVAIGDLKGPSRDQNQDQSSSAGQASSGAGLERLLDELGDQFMGDQSGGQTQDSERIEQLRIQPAQREVAATNSDHQVRSDLKKSDASIVTASSPAERQPGESRESGPASSARKQQVSPQADESLSAEASSLSESEQPHRPSLVMGQLDSLVTSDLNSALANDFYSLHAESIGAQSAAPSAPSPSHASNDLHQDSTNQMQLVSLPPSSSASSSADDQHRAESAAKNSGEQQRQESASKLTGAEPERNLSPQSDLEAAAQTRSGQRQEFGRQPFDERRDNLANIDFSQQAPPSSGDIGGQLVRAFRPQPVASSNENFQQSQQQDGNQFEPSSTLLPFSADNFWRPQGSANNGALPGSDDIGQQYNRARQDPVVSLPPLPPTRFQSLTSPAPFPQQPAPIGNGQAPGGQQSSSVARPGHTHFTGHSFLPSEPFGPSQPNAASRGQQQPAFTSTPQPIISVISGGVESVGSNSVSWNPPPAINPARPPHSPDHAFSTLAPPAGPFSAPHSGQSPPRFQTAHQGEQAPQLPRQLNGDQQHSFRPAPSQQFYPDRDAGARDFVASSEVGTSQPSERDTSPSTTTVPSYSQSASQAPANQWSPLVSSVSVSPLGEREVADSEPRPPVRSSPPATGNGQRPFQFSSPQSTETGFATTLTPPFSPANSNERHARQFGSPAGYHTSSAPTLSGFPSSTPASASPGRIAPTQAATTTPSALEPGAPATNSTKKDDMVIYYYYYYDDNKNATVVAKNISAGAAPPAHINGASIVSDTSMDGDGGIEDTPYMDDPVTPASMAGSLGPSSSQRPQQAPSSTTSTTASTTTPASTRSSASFVTGTPGQANGDGGGTYSEKFDSPPRDKLRFPESSNKPRGSSQRQPPTVDRHNNNNNEDDDVSDAELDQFQNDQQRPPSPEGAGPDSRRTPPSAGFRANQVDQFVSSSPPSVPSPVSFSSTFRPGPRESSSGQHSSNQFTASPNSRQQAPAPHRAFEPSASLHDTSGRHQQASQAAAQGLGQPQANNPAQGRPVSQAAPLQNSRASLSNASRYGTSPSSQFLEPYGMDPAAPASIAHHAAADPLPVSSHQQPHQRQSTQASFSSGAGHATNKKPSGPSSPNSILDSVLASTGAQLTTGSSGEQEQGPAAARQPVAGGRAPAVAQHFSPQRQQQQSSPVAAVSQQRQSAAAGPASSVQAGQRPQSAQLPPARQFYPESSSSQPDRSQLTRLVQSTAPSRPPAGQSSAPSRGQPLSTTTTTSTSTTTQQPSPADLDSKPPADEPERGLPQDLVRDGAQPQAFQPRRPTSGQVAGGTSQLGGSGRPASFDGNTGNGFTRAPPVSPSAPVATSTLASVGQRIQAQPLGQFQTQPARQTSVSTAPSATEPGLARSGPKPPNQAVASAAVQSAPTPTSPGQQAASSSAPQAPQTSASQFSSPPPVATTLISSPAQLQQQSRAGPSSSSGTSTTTSTTTTTTTTTTPTSSSSTTSASSTQAPPSPDAASTESTDSTASSTRRKFGNRNNRFQTRLSASRASQQQGSSTSTSTTRAPQVFGSSSTTTRRPVSSTTRKSSKQLFAGRRRLGGPAQASPSPVEDGSSPPSAGIQTSSPSSNSFEAASPVSASRAKFGNNFTARSRTTTSTSTSTTSAPTATAAAVQQSSSSSSGDSSQLASTAKPGSLFATQRVTFKPRLAFLRTASSQKPTSGDTSAAGDSSSGDSSDSTSSETAAEPASGASDRSGSPAGSSSTTTSATSVVGGQAEPVDSSDQPRAANSTAGTEVSASSATPDSSSAGMSTSTTGAPNVATTSAGSKPKRPLFASRQRSSALFGNRRSSGTNATSTTAA